MWLLVRLQLGRFGELQVMCGKGWLSIRGEGTGAVQAGSHDGMSEKVQAYASIEGQPACTCSWW